MVGLMLISRLLFFVMMLMSRWIRVVFESECCLFLVWLKLKE